MKKYIFCLLFLVSAGFMRGQILSPHATPTSGGYSTGGTTTLSWTIGETYNTTLSVGTTILTQGEQQPYLPGGCVTAPSTPGSIAGPNAVCQLSTATYSITPVAGAVSYTWTVPSQINSVGVFSGMIITSGQGTNSITVSISAGALTSSGAGNVTVTATNACGTSSPSLLSISKKPGTPGTISATSLCGNTTATFSVAPVFAATSYSWTLPTGLTAIGSATGNSITVSKASSFIVGNVSVSAVNACGNIPGPVKTVYGNPPATPAPITGLTSVCAGSTVNYSTAGSNGAMSYLWTVTGSNISVVGSGLSSTVTFGSGFTTGTISVKATNSCGNSSLRTITITKKTIGCTLSPIDINNGVEEEESMLFNLYPNPTNGNFTIFVENQDERIKNQDLTIEVYDVLGNKVLQSLIQNSKSEISLESFRNGMYFVRVVDSNSNTVYSQRVIKN